MGDTTGWGPPSKLCEQPPEGSGLFPLPAMFDELLALPSLPNRGLAPDHPDFDRIQRLQARYDEWAAMVWEQEILPRAGDGTSEGEE